MQGFRDDIGPYLGSRKDRKKVLREIVELEREELGLPPLPKQDPYRAVSQKTHLSRIARPKSVPLVKHKNYLRAPSSLRGKGGRAADDLFAPAPGTDTFWLYGVQKVTQSTLGHLANQDRVTDGELHRAEVCHQVRRKIDSLMSQAASLPRCGILFDIISTSKIIGTKLPERVGAYIYRYIETKYCDVQSVKFTFVGITDNINCCAARDVFCRDEMLQGKYIGQTKRTFEALDNVHMFPVIPGEVQGVPDDEDDGENDENRPLSSSFSRRDSRRSSLGLGSKKGSMLRGRAVTPSRLGVGSALDGIDFAEQRETNTSQGKRRTTTTTFLTESEPLPRPSSVL